MRARLFPLGLLSLAACVNNFHATLQGESVVPGDPHSVGGLLSALPGFNNFGNIDFSQNPDFKNKNISKDQITSVHADAVSVKILDPRSQDFAFLDALKFSVQTGDATALMASRAGIAQLGLHAPTPTLQMQVTHAELKPFVTAPQVSVLVEGTGRPPAEDTRLQATVDVEVEFKVF